MSAHIHLAAIVARDGKLLLHRQQLARQWELPGGPLLPEHEDVDLGMQEILAGMGIEAGPMEHAFIETIYLPRDDGGYLVYNIYDAGSWTGQPLSPDGVEVRWFEPHEVERIEMDEQVRASVLSALGLREPVDNTEAILAAMARAMGHDAMPAVRQGQPGLDTKTRALQTVAILTALGRVGGLRWHIEMAVDFGASPRELAESIQVAADYAGDEITAGARRALSDVLAARGLPSWEARP
ncbi:MAG: hypothetical protein Kow0010_23720 [Dehalococcoidia bacterium]